MLGSSANEVRFRMNPDGQTHVFDPEAGMQPAVVVDQDWATHNKTCPHCALGFEAGDEVLESWDQAVQIHVACVEQLYRLIPDTAEQIEAEYQERRQALLSSRERGERPSH